MIQRIKFSHIEKDGLPGLVSTDAGLFFCCKITKVEKVDVPAFGIQMHKSDGPAVFVDFSTGDSHERDEFYFAAKRLLNYKGM